MGFSPRRPTGGLRERDPEEGGSSRGGRSPGAATGRAHLLLARCGPEGRLGPCERLRPGGPAPADPELLPRERGGCHGRLLLSRSGPRGEDAAFLLPCPLLPVAFPRNTPWFPEAGRGVHPEQKPAPPPAPQRLATAPLPASLGRRTGSPGWGELFLESERRLRPALSLSHTLQVVEGFPSTTDPLTLHLSSGARSGEAEGAETLGSPLPGSGDLPWTPAGEEMETWGKGRPQAAG